MYSYCQHVPSVLHPFRLAVFRDHMTSFPSPPMSLYPIPPFIFIFIFPLNILYIFVLHKISTTPVIFIFFIFIPVIYYVHDSFIFYQNLDILLNI